MGAPMNMDEERRRQAKARADSLIQAGKITSDEELDAFMSGQGIAPIAPADGVAGQNPASFQDFGAKYGGARKMGQLLEAPLRQAARGATFGASDRALAAITAGLDPKVSYDSARTRIDNENRRNDAENPALSLAANLAGGGFKLAPANMLARGATRAAGAVIPGRGTLGQMARLGTTSAVLGGAASVGYQDGAADKSLEQTIQNALFGAKVGGGIGAFIPAAVKAGSTVADLTGARRLGTPLAKNTVPTLPGDAPVSSFRDEPMRYLVGKAKNALTSQEGVLYPTPAGRRVDQRMMSLLTGNGAATLDDAAAAFKQLNGLTNDAMLLDVGGDVMNRANRGARTVGKGASATFNDALGARRGNLSTQMEDDVAEVIGGRQNVPRTLEAREQALRTEADAAYGPLRDKTFTPSALTKETLLNDPDNIFERMWDSGQKSGMREIPRREIPALFGSEPPPQLSTILGADGLPTNAVDVASAPAPKRTLLRNPTVEDIDVIKRGSNVLANDMTDNRFSQTRRDAGLIKDRVRAFVDDADQQIPEYRDVRKQYGDAAERIGAFKAGSVGVDDAFQTISRFSQASPDEVEHFVSGLSDAALKEYQHGLAQDIYKLMDDNAKGVLEKVAATNKSSMRKKIMSAFRNDPDQGDALIARWNARDQQNKNANFIQGGSPTAEKLADQIDAADATQQIGQLTYAPVKFAAGKAAQRAVTGLSKNLADELATRTTLSGQTGEDYLKYLDAYRESLQAKAAGRATRTSRAVGTMVGNRTNPLDVLFGTSRRDR